jgi:hypothetical protein
MARALQHNTTLRVLDVSHNQIGNLGGNVFREVLRTQTTLLTFNIWGNQITDRKIF